MKRLFLVLFLILGFFLLFKGISYAISPAQQATIATQEEWNKDWKYLCLEKWQDFGFNSPEEVKKAQIGKPFPIKMVDIKEFVVAKEIIPQTREAYRYVFPIQVEGKVVNEIHTGLSSGKWETIMIGGNISKVLYEIAAANDIQPDEVNIVFLGTSKYLVFNSNQEEVAVKITENDKSYKNQVDVFKQEAKELQEFISNKGENMQEYIGLMLIEGERSIQQENWLKRLARFIQYKLQI
ncbi:hypothetical protein SAMN02745221_00061 [Thermosyntropha lipolytica DSM 11003]|uniref:Uncharacterized protein n=1 Tax=Thermosyntropha lipolytica DSM 11003 TaxID=1123382 RepID=A0A1M5JCY3_9FIRM|nr:hypothetical protein [Thermosyntropha lipolytica]SHG38235.1 hypothetical protein SAMN02745221_00061 [Thermosyntropha lipolytica DSM 11003]